MAVSSADKAPIEAASLMSAADYAKYLADEAH
jgi:hypothetical protein